jgi:menaquinone-dependent protoporphyrinogen oxidase
MREVRSVLVVYGTKHGHTEKIARRIAERLRESGSEADVTSPKEKLVRDLRSYDGVIIASGVWYERHAKAIEQFVFRNASVLSGLRTAFVSVSGAASTDAGRATASECVEKFYSYTQWRAGETFLIGGGEPYTKYGWFTKWMMLRIARKHGRTRDPQRDYDYTDWKAVDSFARKFAEALFLERRVTPDARRNAALDPVTA